MNIKIFKNDIGKEYLDKNFLRYLDENGLVGKTTCVNTLQQNGIAERKNRPLLEVARLLYSLLMLHNIVRGKQYSQQHTLSIECLLEFINLETPLVFQIRS